MPRVLSVVNTVVSASLTALLALLLIPVVSARADVGDAQATSDRAPVIVLDPGHGGPEVGAVTPEGDLGEKTVNLRIALRLADLLRADGYHVVLTRDTDRSVDPRYTGSGYPGVRNDLQARVDIANAAGADLFISIHNNGGPASESGTEIWYSHLRPFGERNHTLAEAVYTGILTRLRAIGYSAYGRGVKDDTSFRIFRGQTYNIYVLGPGEGPRSHTPTAMPGILGESLFMSNPSDSAVLRRSDGIDAIARGYRDGVRAYFAAYPAAAEGLSIGQP
jgi:N-acetylmuramoyl-L-alanine amidase